MKDEEKVRYDSIYSENISFKNDLIIIYKTVFYLFKPPPVY